MTREINSLERRNLEDLSNLSEKSSPSGSHLRTSEVKKKIHVSSAFSIYPTLKKENGPSNVQKYFVSFTDFSFFSGGLWIDKFISVLHVSSVKSISLMYLHKFKGHLNARLR